MAWIPGRLLMNDVEQVANGKYLNGAGPRSDHVDGGSASVDDGLQGGRPGRGQIRLLDDDHDGSRASRICRVSRSVKLRTLVTCSGRRSDFLMIFFDRPKALGDPGDDDERLA